MVMMTNDCEERSLPAGLWPLRAQLRRCAEAAGPKSMLPRADVRKGMKLDGFGNVEQQPRQPSIGEQNSNHSCVVQRGQIQSAVEKKFPALSLIVTEPCRNFSWMFYTCVDFALVLFVKVQVTHRTYVCFARSRFYTFLRGRT